LSNPGTRRGLLVTLHSKIPKYIIIIILANLTHKVFSPVTCLGFGLWDTPGSRGWVGGVMLVLRTLLELVGRSVQNLVGIGLAVCAGKRDIGTNKYI